MYKTVVHIFYQDLKIVQFKAKIIPAFHDIFILEHKWVMREHVVLVNCFSKCPGICSTHSITPPKPMNDIILQLTPALYICFKKAHKDFTALINSKYTHSPLMHHSCGSSWYFEKPISHF